MSESGGIGGRRVVVTGANSGVGFEISLALATAGADVVLACRDETRGREAAASVNELIKDVVQPGTATSATLDLANLRSVRAFASKWQGPLDVLINNAGVMAIPRSDTGDGYEMQFGVNHLGHFALTNLLLPVLQNSAAPRVVSMSSIAHRTGRMDFDDLQGRKRYGRFRAYSQSKLANLLFIRELDRRARASGSTLIAAAAHPGFARTNLSAGYAKRGSALGTAVSRLEAVISQDAASAALPALFAASMPGVQGGDYIGPDGRFGIKGNPAHVTRSARARNDESAYWLWLASEQLTGLKAVI